MRFFLLVGCPGSERSEAGAVAEPEREYDIEKLLLLMINRKEVGL